FLDAYDRARRLSYPEVLRGLALAARALPQPQPRELLQQLCAQVCAPQHLPPGLLGAVCHPSEASPELLQVQGGARPGLEQLLAVRSSFSGSVLALNALRAEHARALSRVLFLTPHFPAFLLRRRLRSHVLEIRDLDRALLHLGPGQLSEEELRAACYLRGLNPTRLGRAECRAWLEQWLRLSCELRASEASLLAHSMVLLSLNYRQAPE
ncbi:LTMD1 protein, partial [Hirundo rustica]|nr:LTMD1 protein [Hirundo rustica]